MIADVELKPLTREQYNKNLVLGISNGSLKLVDSLSDHYSLPSDTTIFDRDLIETISLNGMQIPY